MLRSELLALDFASAINERNKPGTIDKTKDKSQRKSYLKNISEKLRFIRFIKNFRVKNEVLIFNDENSRRGVDEKFVSFSTDIISSLSDALTFELRVNDKINVNDVETKRIIAEQYVYMLAKPLAFIFKVFYRVDINAVCKQMESIFSEEGRFTPEEIRNIILKEMSCYLIMKNILSVMETKAVFIDCAYTRTWLIQAANKLNIKVIEIQHGIITENHTGYFPPSHITRTSKIDYALVYGDYFNRLLAKSPAFCNAKIESVGSPLIEKFSKVNMEKEPDSFCVSLQYTCDMDVIDIVLKYFLKRPSYNCYLIPRGRPRDFYDGLTLPENVKMIWDESVYYYLNKCEYHITSGSTCAFEAPSFRSYNILVKTGSVYDETVDHLSNMLDLSGDTHVVIDGKDSCHEIIDQFLENKTKSYSHGFWYMDDYSENIISFLKEINLIKD